MPQAERLVLRPIGHLASVDHATPNRTDNANGALGNGNTAVKAMPVIRRILPSEDFLAPDNALDHKGVMLSRAHAATQFRLQLAEARDQLKLLRDFVAPIRYIPTKLVGAIQQPNGTTAERIQLELTVRSGGRTIRRSALTNSDGEFQLSMPARVPFPEDDLRMEVRGANRRTSISISAADIAPNGLISTIILPVPLLPLPQSIIASLMDLLPAPGTGNGVDEPEQEADFPHVTMGEDGHCQYIYNSNATYDRFRYGVFIRLVEPRTSISTPSIRYPVPNSTRTVPVADFYGMATADDQVEYVDRVPVDQPISVDGFRDQLIGLGNGIYINGAETVPMAGTLGLGYVLNMAQKWKPKGLTLGNLVYSLPLAPGEQQRVAIFERRETSIVRERETLSIDEEQAFAQQTDASTDAVFQSAFHESARGGSSFESESSNWGIGGFLGIIGGGGGGSSSEGSSSSWMEGHRDTVARSSQDVHTSVERQAAARRRLMSTSMRLASNFEAAEVTTKAITNHNHTRALTLQYWEVQRLFEITTAVEGATLVCLVPLQVIRFLPPGQPINLTVPAFADSRVEIIRRYSQVLKHADILERRLPRKYRYGLNLVRQFASDPTATFEPAGGAAQDVIHFSIQGTFLPFEDIYVSAKTSRGSRIGPVQLTGAIQPVPEVWGDHANSFPTQDALLANLRGRRQGALHILSGDLAVPPALARNDIIGFEITRRFRQFDYDLVNPAAQVFDLFGITPDVPPDHLISGTVRLSPSELERELGGPRVREFNASIHSVNGGGEESYADSYLTSEHELPPGAFPIPAMQLGPVLRYSQLLEIEEMLQHVVNNTLRYSKAVWSSMTPDERAIMLEGYTIGVPPGGIEDESQNIPLLNCVENRVLGFFGNSMIMPFIIPKGVVDEIGMANSDIQDMLTEFHQSAFSPPKSTIALPTKGVLGEAVLGNCPSAEKIDLTRFWNWQDSASDSATTISDVTLPTQKEVTVGLRGPNALPGTTPLINNINANPNAPGAGGSVVDSLAKAALAQKGFDVGSLTNADALSKLILGDQEAATKARSDAVTMTKELNAQAMATVGNIVGGIYGGNPTAGSSAASAVHGGSNGSGGAAKGKGGGSNGANGSGGNGSAGGEADSD